MAAVNSVRADIDLHHLNQPSDSGSAPTTPKLRDSCDACAASKVKCTRQKPTCARCKKRGMQCEYFSTKRAGRKHKSRPRDTPGATLVTRSSSSSVSYEAGSSKEPKSPMLHQPHSRPPFASSGFADMSSLNITSLEDLASWWTWTSLNSDADDFLVSPTSNAPTSTSFPVPETIDTTESLGLYLSSDDGAISFYPHDTGPFLGPDNTLPITNNIPAVSETNPNLSTDAPSLAQYQLPSTSGDDHRSPTSRCCCLIRSLDLQQQVFRNASTPSEGTRQQPPENTLYQIPKIQSVIAENEQTIDAISNMLQCSCSQDGYLLAIVSLVVFKVLDCYTAAARQTTTSTMDGTQSSTNQPVATTHHDRRQSSHHSKKGSLQLRPAILVGSSRTSHPSVDVDDDHGRIVAQLVVSELQRVQRLVNLLSERLRRADIPDDGEITSPFSGVVLNQLEKDLHKRLAAVCLEIVLRQ